MAITIELPGALREYASGSGALVIDERCASVREALTALALHCPAVADRVMNERGEIREHVNVFVGDENGRFIGGLDAAVPAGGTVTILAAISGG